MGNRTCMVDDCERKHLARGWCGTHYGRWKRTGSTGDADVRILTQSQGLACVVDGCDRERRRRDWCDSHYARWARHGDAGPAEIRDWSIAVGCQVDGCEKPHDSNGYCIAHAHRARRYGDPTHVPTPLEPGDPKAWRKAEVGYLGAHNRVRRLQGAARTYPCQHCGSEARDWAYDHDDPNELYKAVKGYMLPYSIDPGHYMPLCKPCHVVMDKRVAQSRTCSL